MLFAIATVGELKYFVVNLKGHFFTARGEALPMYARTNAFKWIMIRLQINQ